MKQYIDDEAVTIESCDPLEDNVDLQKCTLLFQRIETTNIADRKRRATEPTFRQDFFKFY